MPLNLQALEAVEKQLDLLSAALLASDPEPLERHGAVLHQALLVLGKPRAQEVTPAQHKRLSRCMDRLGQVRQNLMRKSVATERQLATLLPQALPGTYAPLNPARAGRRVGAYNSFLG